MPAPTQVAALAYRLRPDAGAPEVLLVTSRRRRRWILPKGDIEPHLGVLGSVALEAEEEAGVRGDVHPEPLGRYRHGVGPGAERVEVYALRVRVELEAWPEADVRTRRWMSLDEARRRVRNARLRDLLETVRAATLTGA